MYHPHKIRSPNNSYHGNSIAHIIAHVRPFEFCWRYCTCCTNTTYIGFVFFIPRFIHTFRVSFLFISFLVEGRGGGRVKKSSDSIKRMNLPLFFFVVFSLEFFLWHKNRNTVWFVKVNLRPRREACLILGISLWLTTILDWRRVVLHKLVRARIICYYFFFLCWMGGEVIPKLFLGDTVLSIGMGSPRAVP